MPWALLVTGLDVNHSTLDGSNFSNGKLLIFQTRRIMLRLLLFKVH
jgi:hypothetical protein